MRISGMFFNKTCVIKTPVYGSQRDEYGNPIKQSPIETRTVCAVADLRGQEVRIGKQSIVADYIVNLPYGMNINEKSVIVIDGRNLNVTYVVNPAFKNEWLKCYCQLVRQ